MTGQRNNVNEILDVVVVGAGQAGLGMGYFLHKAGYNYVVLERGEVGETWRTQRWDSFALNTPNWSNQLPGMPYEGPQPDGFWLRDELVAYLERYAEHFDIAIQTGVTVTGVENSSDGDQFVVHGRNQLEEAISLLARNVVISSGILQTPKIPAMHNKLPEHILQLHTATYRNPNALPPGSVVVVGSGQSGVQIVEDILPTGRQIYLCTSKVGRLPRRYRGREILDWWRDAGFWDTALEELEDPAMSKLRQPQISGVGRYGHTVSLQGLAREGVVLLGRLKDVEDGALLLADDAAENVAFADAMSARFKKNIDKYITKIGIEAPPLVEDPADEPDPDFDSIRHITRLDLKKADIQTVIWATGFFAQFDWIHLPVLDDKGMPVHIRGISPVPGLFFLGFPWLHSRKSGVLYGIEEDARYLFGSIKKRLEETQGLSANH